MISSLKAKVGDCCYFLVPMEARPRFGQILGTLPQESCVHVMEVSESKYYTVWEQNADWDKDKLKGQKWKEPHNYHRDIKLEKTDDEKKSDKRKCDVYNGSKKKLKRKRSTK
jgi:hypothetical protein